MNELICIVCPKGCHLKVDEDNGFSVSGNGCNRGLEYGKTEVKNPVRVLTSVVRITGADKPVCPVKTTGAIPKNLIMAAMEEIKRATISAPVKNGDVVIGNICNTGISCIATRDIQ